ncbi:Uncharacterised protein [Mycobacterium tuberculosis]|nr:Uncharacterised protein [Mycobacterium tuberculosis]
MPSRTTFSDSSRSSILNRMLTATIPPERLESKSVSLDFFTSPLRVASTRYGASV